MRNMRVLLIVGVILLLLGIATLFVPVPVTERHGIEAGPVSVGFETKSRKRVPAAATFGLIAGGAVLIAAGARKRR